MDFSPESSGEVRVRVDPILTLSSSTVAVPSIGIYDGEVLAYRGILQRGDGGSGPADGMGGISGDCGVMTSGVIDALSPFLFRNRLDFWTDPYDAADFGRLSAAAQAILGSANPSTGGVVARAFAFEMLRRCEGAQLLQTAEEIVYLDPAGKKANMLANIAGRRIGVTSIRVFRYPPGSPYPVEQARVVLEWKLQDVRAANQNVAPADRWGKQVLHVFADGDDHATALVAAYELIAPVLKANTILLITVSDGADGPLSN